MIHVAPVITKGPDGQAVFSQVPEVFDWSGPRIPIGHILDQLKNSRTHRNMSYVEWELLPRYFPGTAIERPPAARQQRTVIRTAIVHAMHPEFALDAQLSPGDRVLVGPVGGLTYPSFKTSQEHVFVDNDLILAQVFSDYAI